MPSLLASCYAVFALYHWKTCFLMKGNRIKWISGRGEVGGRTERVEGEEVMVGIYHLRK